jgi:hypothetical protein
MSKLTWNADLIPRRVSAVYSYGVEYAQDVHNGEVSTGGDFSIARPWTDIAIARNNLPQLVLNEVKKQGQDNLDLVQAFTKVAEHIGGEFTDVIDNYDWGIEGRQEKQYRPGVPTWQKITDSGDLRDSQEMEVDVD